MEPLKNPKFRFALNGEQGLETVWVNKLRFTSRTEPKRTLWLSAPGKGSAAELYHLLADVFTSNNEPGKLPLALYDITQAEIKAQFNPAVHPKQEQIVVTAPNRCSLPHEGLGLVLRQMLEDSSLAIVEQASLVNQDEPVADPDLEQALLDEPVAEPVG